MIPLRTDFLDGQAVLGIYPQHTAADSGIDLGKTSPCPKTPALHFKGRFRSVHLILKASSHAIGFVNRTQTIDPIRMLCALGRTDKTWPGDQATLGSSILVATASKLMLRCKPARGGRRGTGGNQGVPSASSPNPIALKRSKRAHSPISTTNARPAKCNGWKTRTARSIWRLPAPAAGGRLHAENGGRVDLQRLLKLILECAAK